MLIGFDVIYMIHGSFGEFPTKEQEGKVYITTIVTITILVVIAFLSGMSAWKIWPKSNKFDSLQ